MRTRNTFKTSCAALALLTTGLFASQASADQVILDDLIVDGSICAGQDCVNGESFGFDTLRLKENNLRIKFQDTSSTSSFPSNDWQLTANDSSNGGQNKFSIDDIDGGRTPFTIEASAPSHSLYVDDGGRLGLGTSTPVADVHVKSGNTPTVRLEQDGTSGFTAQTWDLAGNEANFFIRDATNGSTLPFRLFPGAPSNALNIEASGDIGLGTTNPTSDLHIFDTAGSAALTLEGSMGTWQIVSRNADGELALNDSGTSGPDFLFKTADTAANAAWEFVHRADDGLGINFATSAGADFILSSTGNLTILGTLTEMSDRDAKTAIEAVDTGDILAKVSSLPVTSWTYTNEAETGVRHIGPMAQDFYAAFGTGHTDKGISTLDSSGVALAAIQELTARNKALEARIAELEKHMQ